MSPPLLSDRRTLLRSAALLSGSLVLPGCATTTSDTKTRDAAPTGASCQWTWRRTA